jgi:hypothetical protein
MAVMGMVPLLAPAVIARMLDAAEDADDRIAERILRTLGPEIPPSAAMGGIVLTVAKQFLGSPYRAGTLEAEGPERLRMNLRGFDCVTLVESSLSIARCLAGGKRSTGDVRAELTRIRYRGGILNGYGSRLHYFSDWIADNEQKGTVKDITGELGGISGRKTIDFMSSHAEAYPRLADPVVLDAVKERERVLSARPTSVLPLRLLPAATQNMEDGDIVGIAASKAGLDIVHTGIITMLKGSAHFLHAPLSGGVVIVSGKPLAEMLRSNPSQTGIVVARPLHP